jgi:hypothetical protein
MKGADPAWNMVSVRGYQRANVAASADVSVNATGIQYAGVVSRHGAVVDRNFYLGEIVGRNGVFTAEVYANVNGVWRVVGTPAPLTSGTGTVRLEVFGTSIKFFVNNVLKVFGNDVSLVAAGSAGFAGSSGATIDNFQVQEILAQPFANNYTENFAAAADGAQLDRRWQDQAGNFSVLGQALKASNAASNISLLLDPTPADGFIQADLTVSTANIAYASLIARYTGPADFYYAALVKRGSVFTVELYRLKKGVYTLLGSYNHGVNNATLRLQTQGTTLTVTVNGVQRIQVADTGHTTGALGLFTSAAALIDNIAAGY